MTVKSLSEFMEEMAGVSVEPDEDDGPRLDALTAREILDNAFRLWTCEHVFAPGDSVTLKRGVETPYRSYRGGIGLFVCYLTDEDRARYSDVSGDNSTLYGYGTRDCVIGRVTPDGAVGFYCCNSRFFEPVMVLACGNDGAIQ